MPAVSIPIKWKQPTGVVSCLPGGALDSLSATIVGQNKPSRKSTNGIKKGQN